MFGWSGDVEISIRGISQLGKQKDWLEHCIDNVLFFVVMVLLFIYFAFF